MFRTASLFVLALALALPACSGAQVVGKTDQQLQEQKNGQPTIDQSKLGPACEGEAFTCPTGQSCSSFPGGGLRCAAKPCAAVTCPSGQQCVILESFPSQIRCQR